MSSAMVNATSGFREVWVAFEMSEDGYLYPSALKLMAITSFVQVYEINTRFYSYSGVWFFTGGVVRC